MRLDDLLLEADIDKRTLKSINIENEKKMVLKSIKGQAAERITAYIRVGEYLAQEREKQGNARPKNGGPYLAAKKMLGLQRIQAIRYTKVAMDKRIQKLTVKDIASLGKKYTFNTLFTMSSMNDKDFKSFIKTASTTVNQPSKSFTGQSDSVLKQLKKYIDDNDMTKINVTLKSK